MLRNPIHLLFGEADRPTDDEHAQLLLKGAQLNVGVGVLTAIGFPFFALMVWLCGPDDRIVPWTAFTCVFLIAAATHNRWVLRNVVDGREHNGQRALVSIPFESAVLGAFTLFAMPEHIEGQLLTLVMIVVSMANNVVARSLTRSLFYASQLPLVSTAVVGFVLADSPVILPAVGLMGYGLVASALLSRISRRVTLESLQMANQNAMLLGEAHQSNLELQRQTHTDALTGLLNRSGFVTALDDILSTGFVPHREGDQPADSIAVLFVDLNRFKAVNDSLGHAAGDSLLIQAASRLKESVRPTDIVARIGGDELTIAAPGISGEGAFRFAERVAAVFEAPFELCGSRRVVSASIGVAYGRIKELDVEDLLAGSDAALYAAKDDASTHIAVFDEQARMQAASERQLRRDLVAAFDNNEIVAHWQPLVCNKTGTLIGVESLARWNDNGTLRPAGAFIDALTQAGLERRLADVMMAEARRARALIPDTSIGLGINVSPSTIRRLLDDPDNAKLWPGVVLEITEHELIGDLEAVRDAIAEARGRGARVYLDDFGTGYSSLSLLADLEIDGLKIDRHFVSTIDQVSSYRIVADIAQIGRRRGYPVVAEGIETREQLRIVDDLGIEFGQGYLFDRAVSLERLVQLVGAVELPWTGAFPLPELADDWVDGLTSDLQRSM